MGAALVRRAAVSFDSGVRQGTMANAFRRIPMFADTDALLAFTRIVLSLSDKEMLVFFQRVNKHLEIRPNLSVEDIEKLTPIMR